MKLKEWGGPNSAFRKQEVESTSTFLYVLDTQPYAARRRGDSGHMTRVCVCVDGDIQPCVLTCVHVCCVHTSEYIMVNPNQWI